MKKIILILGSFLLITCHAQEKEKIKYYLLSSSMEKDLIFIGFFDENPVFYKIGESFSLFYLKQYNPDSLYVQYLRNSRYNIQDEKARLLWVNNDMEIYVLNKVNSLKDENLVVVTNDRIDTVYIEFNSFYQSNYSPFVLTPDRQTLFLVQPEGEQDENLGWYYENIMQIDLTQKQLKAEKLPITGIEMQLAGDYLYYKGGSGNLQNAVFRVKIPEWEKVDTLVHHVDYWFVNNDILYAQIGNFRGQDEWLEKDKFIAYSIKDGKCAIVSREAPIPSDWQPILYKNIFYNFSARTFNKIMLPTITEFPYEQTFPNR